MTHHAIAHFKITGWDETPYAEPEDGPRLAKVVVKKTLSGDFEGESTAELLMCQADPKDYLAGAGYVASEVLTGSLAGREGGFVIQHGGLSGGADEPYTFGNIVPGSGTGALAGIIGKVGIGQDDEGNHTLTLDYQFSE